MYSLGVDIVCHASLLVVLCMPHLQGGQALVEDTRILRSVLHMKMMLHWPHWIKGDCNMSKQEAVSHLSFYAEFNYFNRTSNKLQTCLSWLVHLLYCSHT